jgi:fucose permease
MFTLRRRQIMAVYGSGLLQGISLIMLPAAGPILTDPDIHGLSSGEFGLLFVPQVVAAIVASAGSARLTSRVGSQPTLWFGLGANLLAMALMASSELLPLPLLLAAATMLGVGFGLSISTLNAYAFELFPGRQDAAVTGLHVTTGFGQVLAPLSLALFSGIASWWLAPSLVVIALAGMLRFQRCLPLRLAQEGEAEMLGDVQRLPAGVWLWAAVVFLYGAAEATFGNWSAIFLEQDVGLDPAAAGTGLAVFWASVTIGRVLFAVATLKFNMRPLYVIAPVAVGVAFVAFPAVGALGGAIAVLALAGLGLSFFFPYSVSLASAIHPTQAAAVSGTLVAALMLGTGVSAQVVGVVRSSTGLDSIFRVSSVLALAMLVLAAILVRQASGAAVAARRSGEAGPATGITEGR